MEPPGLHLIPVQKLTDDPRLAPYANLKDSQLANLRDGTPGPDPSGLFIAEGKTVIDLLIASRFRTHSLLIAQPRLQAMLPSLRPLPRGTPVFVASSSVMNDIVGFDIHRGALACGARGSPADPDTLAKTASSAIILEDLTNADNVGAVFRNAAALGGPSPIIFLSPRSCDPLYRKALRVSMGHALRVPFATLSPWPQALDTLTSAAFTTIALTPAGDAPDIRAIKLPPATRPALILGTEGAGLGAAALSRAMLRARISMTPGVDSLNVAVAAAVALHSLLSTNDLQTRHH